MQRYTGYLLIILAASQWGLVAPLCQYCLKEGMTPIEIAFWRALAGGTLLCAHAKMTGSLRLRSGRDGIVLFIFGAACIAGMFGSFQTSVQEGGAALAAILMYTAPVWVAIAARLVFKEELTRRKQLAIWVSLAGVVCISLSGNSGLETISFAAVFFGLASGLLYSGHYIFSKLYLEYYSPFALYGIAMLSAALVSFPFMSVSLDRLVQVWLPLLYLCVVCSYVSYWAYCEGLKRVESTKAVVLATIDPMVGIFVAWLWWGEFFSPAGWVGTIMIVVAVLIIVMERGKGADTQADSAARP